MPGTEFKSKMHELVKTQIKEFGSQLNDPEIKTKDKFGIIDSIHSLVSQQKSGYAQGAEAIGKLENHPDSELSQHARNRRADLIFSLKNDASSLDMNQKTELINDLINYVGHEDKQMKKAALDGLSGLVGVRINKGRRLELDEGLKLKVIKKIQEGVKQKDDPRILSSALKVIFEIPHHAALPFLESLVKHEDSNVRSDVVESLGELGWEAGCGANGKEEIRKRVAENLNQLTGDEDQGVYTWAIIELGKTRHISALKGLTDAIDLLSAIGEHNGAFHGLNSLEKILWNSHEDEKLNQAAYETLMGFTVHEDPKISERAKKLLDSYSEATKG